MTVYVVTVGTCPSDGQTVGIYTTEEKANAVCAAENAKMRALYNYPETFAFADVEAFEVEE